MIGHLLKYQDFYHNALPDNKFGLVNDIPKVEVIYAIASLNYLNKPPLDLNFNSSIEGQIELIKNLYLVQQDGNNIKFCISHIKRFLALTYKSKGATLFTRVTFLHAYDQIIDFKNFENETISNFKFNLNHLENLFKFLLICNNEILENDPEYEKNATSENLKDKFFEFFMFKELPHNQHYFIQNPVNLLYRANALLSYFHYHYPSQLASFATKYGLESFRDYIKMILSLFIQKEDILPLIYYKVPHANEKLIAQLNLLSERNKGNAHKKFEFLEIKKNPLYRYTGIEQNIYVLMDNIYLIEKVYDLFINDFYFEELYKTVKRESYGGKIGYFFEEYIENIFTYIFYQYKKVIFKSTSSLTIKGFEYADYYIREKKNIVLIQAKSSYLAQGKLKEITSYEEFEKLKADGTIEEFYKKFGLYQLVENSIKLFFDYAPKIDNGLPKSKLQIFPILLVNEPIVSRSLTSFVFNEKFVELLSKNDINLDNEKAKIHRLIILHISELERIQESLHTNKVKFWNLIYTYQFSVSKKATLKNLYAPFQNFDSIIKKKIKNEAFPKYVHQHLLTYGKHKK